MFKLQVLRQSSRLCTAAVSRSAAAQRAYSAEPTEGDWWQKEGHDAYLKKHNKYSVNPTEEHHRLSKESGVPAEQVANPTLHLLHYKLDAMFESLNLTTTEQKDGFLNKYLVSPGFPTMEFAQPMPPPFHTYEEAPVIKE